MQPIPSTTEKTKYMEGYTMLMDQRTQSYKTITLPKLVHCFNAISIKTQELILNGIWKRKGQGLAKTTLQKKKSRAPALCVHKQVVLTKRVDNQPIKQQSPETQKYTVICSAMKTPLQLFSTGAAVGWPTYTGGTGVLAAFLRHAKSIYNGLQL